MEEQDRGPARSEEPKGPVTFPAASTDVPARPRKGDSRDIVGKQLGVCGRTADKMAQISRAIDEADRAGDTDKAQKLRTAREKSTEAAYRLLRSYGPPPTKEQVIKRAVTQFNAAKRKLNTTRKGLVAALKDVGVDSGQLAKLETYGRMSLELETDELDRLMQELHDETARSR